MYLAYILKKLHRVRLFVNRFNLGRISLPKTNIGYFLEENNFEKNRI